MPKTNSIKRIGLISIYSFLIGLILFSFYLFIPRNYDAKQYKINKNTKYWKLSNSADIAYIHLPAKHSKNDFPIVYLHGGPGGAIHENIIEMLMPFTDNGYDVYAYDQVGSGASSRLNNVREYTVKRHCSDLAEVIGKIGSDKVIIIGQSWGSVLATAFLLKDSSKVDKVIMTGPGPIFPLNPDLEKIQAPDSLNIKKPTFSNSEGNKKVYTFREKCIRWCATKLGLKLIADSQVDQFFTKLNSELNKSTVFDTSLIQKSFGGGGYYAHIMTMHDLYKQEDQREELKKINTPILILKGQYDNQKWGFTQEYSQLMPNVKFELIPEAGHHIFAEQPDIYYREILDFMEE